MFAAPSIFVTVWADWKKHIHRWLQVRMLYAAHVLHALVAVLWCCWALWLTIKVNFSALHRLFVVGWLQLPVVARASLRNRCMQFDNIAVTPQNVVLYNMIILVIHLKQKKAQREDERERVCSNFDCSGFLILFYVFPSLLLWLRTFQTVAFISLIYYHIILYTVY